MLERHHLVLAGGPGRVDEADHAENVALGVRQRDEVAALPDRARGDEGATQELFTPGRRVLRIRVGLVRAGPRHRFPYRSSMATGRPVSS